LEIPPGGDRADGFARPTGGELVRNLPTEFRKAPGLLTKSAGGRMRRKERQSRYAIILVYRPNDANTMTFWAFLLKNWVLALAFLTSGALLLWPFLQRRLSTVKEIGTHEATLLINAKNAILLDVREPKEMQGSRLPNAVHIPLSQLKARAGELAKSSGRPIIMYDDKGQGGRLAAGTLAKQGFDEIYLLGGGYRAWKGAGLPLAKDPGTT
jgi:rhodanese-related sulfurtransferase